MYPATPIERFIFALVLVITVAVMAYTTQEPPEHTPLPKTAPACADAVDMPTDGVCKAYDEALKAEGYVQLPDNTYVLRKESPNRGV